MSITSKISISYSDGVSKIAHEHDGDGSWRDHVKAMVNFLRGVGYTVPREFEDVINGVECAQYDLEQSK